MPYSNSDKARDYQREYRRLRRAGDERTTPSTTAIAPQFRLQTAQDVIDLLQEQVQAVRADTEARTIGYLCGIALRAIEAGDIAARLEMVELVLKQRNGDGKP